MANDFLSDIALLRKDCEQPLNGKFISWCLPESLLAYLK